MCENAPRDVKPLNWTDEDPWKTDESGFHILQYADSTFSKSQKYIFTN